MDSEWVEEQPKGDIASCQSNELLLKAAAKTVTTFSCYLASRLIKVNKYSHRLISATTPYKAQEQRSYILNSWKEFFLRMIFCDT